MRIPAKIVLLTLIVGLISSGVLARSAGAVPIGAPTLSSASVEVGSTTTVTASWGPDETGDPAILQALLAIGVFTQATITVNVDATFDGLSTGTLTIQDADATVDLTTTVEATFRCDSAGTTTFRLTHNGSALDSATLSCTSTGGGGEGGGGVSLGGIAFVIDVIAEPNQLLCGGTAEISALGRDASGDVVPGVGFVFSTDQGLLEVEDANSATLTLLPGDLEATVTATTIDFTDPAKPEAATGEVLIQNFCGPEGTAIAVTANPNVIGCSGSSLITATARDAAGHVIEGVGYHFTTDVGSLVVGPPNTANAIGGHAILTLLPGQGTATVRAWMDGLQEKPGEVVVQQFCRDFEPSTIGAITTAPGKIELKSSSTELTCGESAFIGATVRDANGQIVPDGTEVNFLTNSGRLEPAQNSTLRGALNVTLRTEPVSTSGILRITAASGSSFGTLDIEVNCGVVPAAAAPSTGAPACIPIGDNVCITPPGTGGGGVRITPPNTGDGGLFRP